ncbi:MAG: FG-GAP-like repeat-containing protein [Desulfobacterales bacterium]|nr:FG-GAP-like repeat-containing protein [Desulfobacterales bacterium]
MQLHHWFWIRFGILFSGMVFLTACSVFNPGPADKPGGVGGYDHLIDRAHHLINDRQHLNALKILEKAGGVKPGHPEWLYESGRALFAMDRFKESAKACQKALKVDPQYYDAMALGWAARLEEGEVSEKTRQKVRSEIQKLLETAADSPEALLAAYRGYEWLDDEPAQQELILRIVPLAASESAVVREQIAANLFEQIIQARDDKPRQTQLMRAYIKHFPKRRFVEYLINSLLETEWEAAEAHPGPMAFVQSALPDAARGKRVNVGIALWLIEQDKMPDKAVELLSESIEIAHTQPEEIPPFFDNALWQAEQKKETDYMHYLLGRAYFNAGQMDQAAAELRYVAGENRHWSGVYHYLGRIAELRGSYDQAIADYRRALEIDDRQEDTEDHLSDLLAAHRDYTGEPAHYFSEQTDTITFTDVTESAGLADIQAKQAAWGDFNGDGFADLLLNGRMLFRNNRDGTFTDISKAAGLDQVKRSRGGIWADYDNDGDLDIYVTSHAENYLLENRGAGKFEDVTDMAFDGPLPKNRTEAAAFGDMDNDGFLDLYIANYERRGVMRGLGTHDRLYDNKGDGTFAEVSFSAGVYSGEAMCGRGVTWSDVNADGYQDIVVANYRLDPNFLWLNDQNGGFTDKAETFNIRGNMTDGAFGHSIGPASGDLDNDKDLDLIITNLAHPRYIQYSDKTMVLMSTGAPSFEFVNRFDSSGIAFEETHSDPALADVDNDGDLDLYITSIYSGRNAHLYLNDGTGRFTDITWLSGTRLKNTWGAAFADFNNDGFIDLLVASSDGVTLLKNNGNDNHWVKVAINDSQCNRYGIGSRIRVFYDGKQQVREVICGRGTGSQDDTAVIFGLGEYSGPVRVEARTLCGDRLGARIAHPDQVVVLEN